MLEIWYRWFHSRALLSLLKWWPYLPKSSAALGFGFELLHSGERFRAIMALLFCNKSYNTIRQFGHVSRSSGLAKTILQGTVKGKRRSGRQMKRWDYSIKEWTGLLVGWLFWASRPFETVFQSISGRLPEGGRKQRAMIAESKNVHTAPTRNYCKRSRPLPTIIKLVGRSSTGSLPRTIAPPDLPPDRNGLCQIN